MNKELEIQLIEDYKNKIPLVEIKRKYHISSNTIYKIIDTNNVSRTTFKDLSKFKNLESPETQYWIGYICADGNIEYKESSRVFKVSLFSKDECVIDDFINYFGNICKKYQRKQNNIYEAAIHSKDLCQYFIDILNITPNKGLTLNPNIEFTSSFIRGYFDGDGSIRKEKSEAKFTSGSKVFVDKLSDIFRVLNIYHVIREKGNAYDICFERKTEVEKLYKFLYSEKSQVLKRKLDNFVALYGNIDEENTVNCGKDIANPQPSIVEIQ